MTSRIATSLDKAPALATARLERQLGQGWFFSHEQSGFVLSTEQAPSGN